LWRPQGLQLLPRALELSPLEPVQVPEPVPGRPLAQPQQLELVQPVQELQLVQQVPLLLGLTRCC
jgi:hypothetical protein